MIDVKDFPSQASGQVMIAIERGKLWLRLGSVTCAVAKCSDQVEDVQDRKMHWHDLCRYLQYRCHGFGQVGTVPLVVTDPCFDDRLYAPPGGAVRYDQRIPKWQEHKKHI